MKRIFFAFHLAYLAYLAYLAVINLKNLIMKLAKLLFFALILFSASCKNEEVNFIDTELKAPVLKELIGSKIAHQESDKIILDVSDSMIMQSFKKFIEENDLKLNPQSFKVVSIDNKNYLRFYSDNNQVSTIALIKGKDNQYIVGKTVCTSTACASGGGCVPNGLYCTECIPPYANPEGPIRGDCTRVTTSEDE